VRATTRVTNRLAEKFVWSSVVAAAAVVMGAGLSRTLYFEPTSEALEAARTGTRMVVAASVALMLTALVGWRRGAPRGAMATVVMLPALPGGLTVLWGESLFPHLAYLAAAPCAGAGVLAALVLRWRDPSGPGRAARPS
jgi:hypothetical protein